MRGLAVLIELAILPIVARVLHAFGELPVRPIGVGKIAAVADPPIRAVLRWLQGDPAIRVLIENLAGRIAWVVRAGASVAQAHGEGWKGSAREDSCLELAVGARAPHFVVASLLALETGEHGALEADGFDAAAHGAVDAGLGAAVGAGEPSCSAGWAEAFGVGFRGASESGEEGQTSAEQCDLSCGTDLVGS
jgi:hypothetical protein